ncbi:MAG: hypothetical protein ACKOBM_12285, partial [Gammaproteobacteria bacterium]
VTKARTGIDSTLRLGATRCVTARELLQLSDGAPPPGSKDSAKDGAISRYVRTDGGSIERRR